MICGKKITYCIYRTEYPWGLSPKIRPATHFLYKSFGVGFHLNFLILSTIYQYISGENDSNSNNESSQRHNLCQTVITKVSNNKPFVKSKQILPQRYLYVGCQLNSDQALRLLCLKGHVRARGSMLWRHRWQEASKILCTKIPLWRELSNHKNGPRTPEMLSPTRY